MTSGAKSEARRAFEATFGRAARSVRTRLALGRAVSGATIGLGVAAVLSLGLLLAGRPQGRLYTGGAAALGFALGLAAAKRQRLDDEEVALVLDAKLASREVITTAVAARDDDELSGHLLLRATSALEAAPRQARRVPVLVRSHALLPLVAASFALAARWPSPLPPAVAPAPGSDIVRVADVRGLEKVAALGALGARDDAQRERLKKIAADAEKLRRKLEAGAERREVKDDLAKLADAIAAERMSLGDGAERKGLESAMAELGKNADLGRAKRALGDHDLTAFDDEMQRLANRAEEDSRKRAQQSLADAEQAAQRSGAPSVAKMLADQRQRLSRRSEASDALRDLANELGRDLDADGQRALDELGRSGDPKAARELARSLDQALRRLGPDARKRLAARMKELARKHPDAKGLGELSARLGSPPSADDLERALEDLANAPESDESERQRALDDAQRGLGGDGASAPMPMPVHGGGGSGQSQAGSGGDGQGTGANGGPGGDSARGASNKGSAGPTAKVDAADLRAHASTQLGAGTPMPGTVLGRAPARAGETANTRGTGALGAVGPDEVGGVSRSDVPEEYREQVGRYFQP